MAFFKGSFYEKVPLFQPDETGRIVFKGVCARPLSALEPVLEHSVALKNRLDGVSQEYYADPRYWRRVADANPGFIFPEDILWSAEPIAENGREHLGDVVLIARKRDGG